MSMAEGLDLSELDCTSYRCARCGSDQMEQAICWQCGGAGGFNRYEENPLAFLPDDWLRCDACRGNGFIHYCDECPELKQE